MKDINDLLRKVDLKEKQLDADSQTKINITNIMRIVHRMKVRKQHSFKNPLKSSDTESFFLPFNKYAEEQELLDVISEEKKELRVISDGPDPRQRKKIESRRRSQSPDD